MTEKVGGWSRPGRLLSFLPILAAVALGLAACEEEPPKPVLSPDNLYLTEVDYDALPGWRADSVLQVGPALKRSCERLLRGDADRTITAGPLETSAAQWRPACQAALDGIESGAEETFRRAIETHFTPFAAAAGEDPDGLITGYFEAELRGAAAPDAQYAYPIYARPDDHIIADLGIFDPDLKGQRAVGRVQEGRFVPYPARADLERTHLPGRGLELFWARDPIDVFLLQVQGSGRVVLPDGTVARIGFDGHNGRPYKSVGRVLIDRGDLQAHEASCNGIRGWIEKNPERANELLWENPRFVFFRELEGDGPIGAEGLPLTPGRSLAVDRAHIAMGTLIWLDTTWPSAPDRPLQRLMVAQDTGGAIKGPVRGDFFWGFGAEALAEAGKMKSTGRYYLLLPNEVAATIRPSG